MKKRRRNSYRLLGHDYADASYAYFVTIDTKIKHVTDDCQIDPKAPFTSCRALGQRAHESLLSYRLESKLLIYAYCLMPDHLHLLIRPGIGADLSVVLGSYQSWVTRTSWEFGVIGRLWQRSYYDHILRRSDDAGSIVDYILNNPIRAGLVDHWRDWPWCGTPDCL